LLDGQTIGERALVSHQLFVHGLASIEFARRFKVEAALPVALSQGGEQATGLTLSARGGAGLGDLRLGARAEVAEQEGWFPSVALGLSVWLPTASAGPFSGASSARVAPALTVSSLHPRFLWSASLQRRFQEPEPGSLQRSEVIASAALALRLGPLQLGPEFWMAQATEGLGLPARTSRAGGEVLLTGRYRAGPLDLSLGAGPGLGNAPGVPAYRVLAGVAFSPERLFQQEQAEGGASYGGSLSSKNPEPTQIEVISRPGAPGSGVTPGDRGQGQVGPDQDGDGVPDARDACPGEAGVVSLDPKKDGCPPDQDGDGIPDAKDACPGERGEASAEPKDHGCPKSVRVEGGQIVILQQVNFKTGSDEIDAGSFGLLQQVTDVMQQHPEITRVAIDGHTDDKGNVRTNVELSRRRAAAVLRWMSEHGVDARRLEARGFGPKRPVADNKTEAGRAKNRRVEFQILKRSARGEAGWQEGSVTP
jgi:outer membrane protein OmpA-like peptidoglycan-associated protein